MFRNMDPRQNGFMCCRMLFSRACTLTEAFGLSALRLRMPFR